MSDKKPVINLESLNDTFKLPIRYNKEVKILNETVINDLELVKTLDSSEKPIYEDMFNPQNRPSRKVIEQLANYYTTDINYLKDAQQLTKNIKNDEINSIYNEYNMSSYDIENVLTAWEEIKSETGFCEKYLYIDWQFAKQLNNNASFLQFMSIYNIASPILSLCLPIFILIIPFFIIKVKGYELNIKEYIEILKGLIANHSVAKIFTQFHQVDTGQKVYLLISSAFYLFSIYQNILICVRFYSNMKKIHDYLDKFKRYINTTIQLMNYFSYNTNKLTTFEEFNVELKQNIHILEHFKYEIDKITPFTFSLIKLGEIGHIMHTFYQLYDNVTYHNAILYSFGFHGYCNIMSEIKTNMEVNKVNNTTFLKKENRENKNKKPIFKKMYYPKLINEKEKTNKIIKNDCNLNKNIIITGPNASGKTTTLKSVLINILLSQQIGCGCFESCKLTPYDNIHCYLNIPDTSGRDSLFQAEARRCKDIIECIQERTDETHFCIFDELYSGTNPEEAVVSAFAFMDYIAKNDNITCMLTTHYMKLCKKLAKNKNIKNYHMKTVKKNDNFDYTYLIEEGISKIKGGLKVLKDMNYPKEILDNTEIYK